MNIPITVYGFGNFSHYIYHYLRKKMSIINDINKSLQEKNSLVMSPDKLQNYNYELIINSVSGTEEEIEKSLINTIKTKPKQILKFNLSSENSKGHFI